MARQNNLCWNANEKCNGKFEVEIFLLSSSQVTAEQSHEEDKRGGVTDYSEFPHNILTNIFPFYLVQITLCNDTTNGGGPWVCNGELCTTKFSHKSFLAKVIIDFTNLMSRNVLRVELHMEKESLLFRLFKRDVSRWAFSLRSAVAKTSFSTLGSHPWLTWQRNNCLP